MNNEVFDNIDFIDIQQVGEKIIENADGEINNKLSNFLCKLIDVFYIWNLNQTDREWYKQLPTEFTDEQKLQIADFFIKIEPLLVDFKRQRRNIKGGDFPIRAVEVDSNSNSQNQQNFSELSEMVGRQQESFLKQIEQYLLSQQIPEEISSEDTFKKITFILTSLDTMNTQITSLIGPSQFTSNTDITTNSEVSSIIYIICYIYEFIAKATILPTFYLYIPLVIFAAISDMMSADVRQEDIIVSLCNIYKTYPYLFDLTCKTFVSFNQLIVSNRECDNNEIPDKLKTVSNLMFLVKIFSENELQLDVVIETFKSIINEIHKTSVFSQIKGLTLKDIYKMFVLLDTQTEKDILGDKHIQEVLKQLAKNHCIAQLFNIINLPLTDSP